MFNLLLVFLFLALYVVLGSFIAAVGAMCSKHRPPAWESVIVALMWPYVLYKLLF